MMTSVTMMPSTEFAMPPAHTQQKSVPRNNATDSRPRAARANTSQPSSDGSGKPVSSGEQQKRTGLPPMEQAKFDARFEEINKKIENLKSQLDSARQELKGVDNIKDGLSSKRQELRTQLQHIRAEQRVLQDRRTSLLTYLKESQVNRDKQFENLKSIKSKLPFQSVEQVDTAVMNLERQIESGLSLQEEKRTLSEISNLKRSRKAVEEYKERMASFDDGKGKQNEFRDALKANDVELSAVKSKADAIVQQLDTLKEEGDGKFGQLASKIQSRQELSKTLDAEYVKLRDLHNEVRTRREEHYNTMKLVREKRAEEYRVRREQEEIEQRTKREQRERERALIPPYVDEIALCNSLSHYLSQFVSSEASTMASMDKQTSTLRAVTDEPLVNNARVFKRGEANNTDAIDDFFSGMAKKKERKTAVNTLEKKKPISMNLRHPLSILSDFTKVSIQVPNLVSEIPSTIKYLEDRKNELEVKQAEIMKKRMEKLSRGESVFENKEEETSKNAEESSEQNVNENTEDHLEDGEILS